MAPPRGPVGRACSLAGWGFLHGLSATHRKSLSLAWGGGLGGRRFGKGEEVPTMKQTGSRLDQIKQESFGP